MSPPFTNRCIRLYSPHLLPVGRFESGLFASTMRQRVPAAPLRECTPPTPACLKWTQREHAQCLLPSLLFLESMSKSHEISTEAVKEVPKGERGENLYLGGASRGSCFYNGVPREKRKNPVALFRHKSEVAPRVPGEEGRFCQPLDSRHRALSRSE